MSEPEPALEIPAEFLTEVVPRCRDIVELKVVLLVMEIAVRRGRSMVSLPDLLAPDLVGRVLAADSPEPVQVRLRRALDKGVADGALLRLNFRGQEDVRFLVATAENEALVRRVLEADPGARVRLGIEQDREVDIARPNSFALYERHIGPLTPLIAEQLRQAEASYPRAWIEEAILTAVDYNRRNWRYVETILARWEENGAPSGTARYT